MLTQTSKRIVGRDTGRVIESIPATRALAKRSALAAVVALTGFGFYSIAGAADVGLALAAYGLLVFGRVSPVVVVALSVLVGSLWLT